jgi:hypothetical protein
MNIQEPQSKFYVRVGFRQIYIIKILLILDMFLY